MSGQTYILKCDIAEGMFNHEAVAKVGGEAFIVHRKEVLGPVGQRARLRVRVVQRNGDQWIVLPTDYKEIVLKTAEMELVAEG